MVAFTIWGQKFKLEWNQETMKMIGIFAAIFYALRFLKALHGRMKQDYIKESESKDISDEVEDSDTNIADKKEKQLLSDVNF